VFYEQNRNKTISRCILSDSKSREIVYCFLSSQLKECKSDFKDDHPSVWSSSDIKTKFWYSDNTY